MKIYIFCDMEGISGISCTEMLTGNALGATGSKLMAADINACIAGCLDAGADEIIVRDGHGGRCNITADMLDSHADLIQGATPGVRFADIDNSDGLILLGYHAMAGTDEAILEHSYSSREIQNLYLNGRKTGEIAVDAAIASEHGVKTILVTGDDKTCAEARNWIPSIATCEVKKGFSSQGGRLMSPERAHEQIRRKTCSAIINRDKIEMFRISYPVTLRWEFVERTPLPTGILWKKIDARTSERTSDSLEEIFQR